MSNPNFVVGDVRYGNNLNDLSGRYQTIHFSGWSAATDATTGTPGTTTVAFDPVSREYIEILDVVLWYPSASGAVSTPGQWSLRKFAAGTSTPSVQLCSGLTIATEASIPINTVRRFSAATFTSATYAPAQVGLDAYSYPYLVGGDLPYLLLGQVGVGGTQTAIKFGYIFRERPLGPTGPTLATAGTTITFGG